MISHGNDLAERGERSTRYRKTRPTRSKTLNINSNITSTTYKITYRNTGGFRFGFVDEGRSFSASAVFVVFGGFSAASAALEEGSIASRGAESIKNS